jgi:hypothetical protein
MKRDMNLIRLFLLETEGEDPKPDLSAYTEDQRVYHSALLIEAELVHGEILLDGSGQPNGTVVYELNKTQLRGSKQPLIFGRVNDVTLHVVQTNLTPNIILKLVQIFKWIINHSFLPSSLLFTEFNTVSAERNQNVCI